MVQGCAICKFEDKQHMIDSLNVTDSKGRIYICFCTNCSSIYRQTS